MHLHESGKVCRTPECSHLTRQPAQVLGASEGIRFTNDLYNLDSHLQFALQQSSIHFFKGELEQPAVISAVLPSDCIGGRGPAGSADCHKMHEFQQYSQITHGRFQQVCHILAGVSGSRPIKIHEQHLVYQQLKVNDHNPVKKGAPKPASGPALRSNYERLVRDLSGSESDGAASAWRLLHEELPEAGVKSVISRAYSDNPIDDATLQKFRPGSEWYRYVKQFIVSGTRFVSGNVIVKISQIMLPFQASTETPLDAPLPSNEDLRPLDPSGAYLVESCVRIDDATNSKLRERAIEELTAFTKSLEGAVDLRVPDRLALDTRVKAS